MKSRWVCCIEFGRLHFSGCGVGMLSALAQVPNALLQCGEASHGMSSIDSDRGRAARSTSHSTVCADPHIRAAAKLLHSVAEDYEEGVVRSLAGKRWMAPQGPRGLQPSGLVKPHRKYVEWGDAAREAEVCSVEGDSHQGQCSY